MSADNRDARLRLSAQRALIGAVPDALRAVYVEIADKRLVLHAIFASEPATKERDLMCDVSGEILSDYLPDEVSSAEEDIRVVPEPTRIDCAGILVFMRADRV